MDIKKLNTVGTYILSGLITVGFFGLLWLLISISIPEQNKEILNIVVGALIGSFSSIVAYFFGSSLGSARKDEIIRGK